MKIINTFFTLLAGGVFALGLCGCDDSDGESANEAPASLAGAVLTFNPQITLNADGTFAYDGSASPTANWPNNAAGTGNYTYIQRGEEAGLRLEGTGGGLTFERLVRLYDFTGGNQYTGCKVHGPNGKYNATFGGTLPDKPSSKSSPGDTAPSSLQDFAQNDLLLTFDSKWTPLPGDNPPGSGKYAAMPSFLEDAIGVPYAGAGSVPNPFNVTVDFKKDGDCKFEFNVSGDTSNATYRYDKTGADTATVVVFVDGVEETLTLNMDFAANTFSFMSQMDDDVYTGTGTFTP